MFTYLGMVIAVRRQQEVEGLDRGEIVGKGGRRRGSEIKVVDTSAIIDGRIADVYETKFLSGTMIVGRFILKELQDIADSADGGKRARGRRGLDILQRMQEHPDLQVKVVDKDYPEVRDVDGKLVMLAREFDAKILTTDFNLNKVASLQGVTVLNVNDLANALKPAVLPGDGMVIFIAKEGKEKEQGVGYLDDGTMVVVEEGRRMVGKKVDATVTSVLQTSAGRMIFTKMKENGSRSIANLAEKPRSDVRLRGHYRRGRKRETVRRKSPQTVSLTLSRARPLLWWAVHAFEQSPSIGSIVVVVPAPTLAWARRQFVRWKVKTPLQIVEGGATRADSVRQGLAVVPAGARWIAVHDGVRPLVTLSVDRDKF